MSDRINKLLPFTIAATFIWVGFVCAISFMEAWLKFQAPGITIPLGLGIGRLVFGALNKVELVLSVIILVAFFMGQRQKFWLFFFIAFVILILQTLWLLPALDARALKLLAGETLPKSNLHFLYIIIEFIKVVCLILFGFRLMKSNNTFA